MTELRVDPKPQCSETVYGTSRYDSFHPHQCRMPVKVFRDGKPWCARHDPVAIKAKRDAKAVAREAAHAADDRRRASAEHRAELLGGGKPDHVYAAHIGYYTGGIVLTPEEADALIERLPKKGAK